MESDEGPTVSVIIPTYYRNEELINALESVKEQTYPHIECIVVDDSGERFAEEAIDTDNLTYVAHEQNQGAPVARLTGLEQATGKYIQFLDDDDYLYPRKVEVQVELLEQSDVGVVYCGIRMADGREILPTEEQLAEVRKRALTFDLWPCYTCSMLIERELLMDIDDFTEYEGAQDGALRIELAHATEFDAVFEVLVDRTDTDRSLGDSRRAVTAHFDMIEGKRDLYAAAGEDVRRQALAYAHSYKGFYYMRYHFWSIQACLSFLRAVMIRPQRSNVLPFVASLFGKPGWKAGQRLKRALGGTRGPAG